jgi:hypothetical protein
VLWPNGCACRSSSIHADVPIHYRQRNSNFQNNQTPNKMTYLEFQESGKMSPVNGIDQILSLKLHPDCSDIIKYKDGTIIQSIKTGGFMYSDRDIGGKSNIFGNKLDSVEEIVYKLKYSEIFC